MFLKWFITIAIAYFIYKYYIKPNNFLGSSEEDKRQKIRDADQKKNNEDEEYIDYEEVE